jgi:NAD(P)H-dependent flavin oxidoreductase YrpB (nitropropane dioxygenase family)
MGVGVSSWRLASAVASAGQLGVVSGVGLDTVLVRRLQDGDRGGSVRRALAAFPVPDVARRALTRFFRPGGRAAGVPYAAVPKLALRQRRTAQELAILGNFVEVWLAKEGHQGPVGVNYLEKIQMATPAAVYGAMLAGVDHVLMGAGIPREIPALLDAFSDHRAVRLPVDVQGAATGTYGVDLDPVELFGTSLPPLARPVFLAVISAHVLATYLARDPAIRPDGFVVEGSRAGGHNAPPRGKGVVDETGQPVFGPRDEADLAVVASTGLPFWVAGGQGTPEALASAVAAGAQGVQVGSLFALSRQSGLAPALRTALLSRLAEGTLEVRTDALASPTGFPFKVAQLEGTLSEPGAMAARERLCDLGYLRAPYLGPGGTVGYRCPSEPVEDHLRRGGTLEATVGRACLCNSLMANVGLAQTREDGSLERALVTLGADLDGPRRLLAQRPGGWTAAQAVTWLLDEAADQVPLLA